MTLADIRQFIPTTAAIVAIATFSWLGLWQLDRAAEKERRSGTFAARTGDAPILLNERLSVMPSRFDREWVALSPGRRLGGGGRRTSVPARQPHPGRGGRLSRLCAAARDGSRSRVAGQSRVGGDRPESRASPGRLDASVGAGGLGDRGLSEATASPGRRRLRPAFLAQGRAADRSGQDGSGSRAPGAPIRGLDGCGDVPRLHPRVESSIWESEPNGIVATRSSGSRWRPRWPSYGSWSGFVAPGDTEARRRTQRRNRSVLVGLVAVFTVPMLIAYALNVWWPHWSPFGHMNYGEIVAPAWKVELAAMDREVRRPHRRALGSAASGRVVVRMRPARRFSGSRGGCTSLLARTAIVSSGCTFTARVFPSTGFRRWTQA